MSDEEFVVLVDKLDQPCGVAEKLEAHRSGLLHRAISVFLFDKHGRLLLQRRAENKYHSPGLWANTCCGHPRPGEKPIDAARRRLLEELGIESHIEPVGTFAYQAGVGEGLAENEYVHLFKGIYDGRCLPNRDEVSEVMLIEPHVLAEEPLHANDRLTPWFRIYLEEFWGNDGIFNHLGNK